MMKDKVITFMMDSNEYKQFMEEYHKALIAGNCTNKSDYIRQALLAFSHNGQDSIQEGEQEVSKDSKQEEAPIANAFDFSQLDL